MSTESLTERLEQIVKEMRLVLIEMHHEGVNGWPNSVESWADQLAAALAEPQEQTAQEKHEDVSRMDRER